MTFSSGTGSVVPFIATVLGQFAAYDWFSPTAQTTVPFVPIS